VIRSDRRRAATLLELLIGIAVGIFVVALAVGHTVRHQRTYSAVDGMRDLRARLRDASDIITADLRGSSPAGDSILVALDTALEFYSVTGVSMLCAPASSNEITLPPDSLPSGRVLSSWISSPEAGDVAVVLADSAGAAGSRWSRAGVVAVATISTPLGCPVSAGLLSASDVLGPARSYRVSLSPGATVIAARGAPVRLVRRVRYSVYRGGDARWYLGYRRCVLTCAVIQPVSGPYESASGPPLSFRYFTRTGAVVVVPGPTADVARVEIITRAEYQRSERLPGMSGSLTGDSTAVSVALRNTW
jgi:hypothetical protein